MSDRLKISGNWEDAISKAIKADPAKLPRRKVKRRKVGAKQSAKPKK